MGIRLPDDDQGRDSNHEHDGFGSAADTRRLMWAVLSKVHETSDNGADWNEVLAEAEQRGINRQWTHEEIKRRLRWGDAHLHDGNIHPHNKKRFRAGLLYEVMESGSETVDTSSRNIEIGAQAAARWSLRRILHGCCRYGTARTEEVLSTAEEYGLDWMWAHEILTLWDERGDITFSQGGERVELEH